MIPPEEGFGETWFPIQLLAKRQLSWIIAVTMPGSNSAKGWRPEGVSYWFDPILERLEEFENSTNIFPEIAEGLSEAGPEWVAMCLYRSITDFRPFLGFENISEGLNARRVGAFVGCKISFSASMAKMHDRVRMLSSKQRERLEDACGAEEWLGMCEIWREYAEKINPRAKDLRRFATELSHDQATDELTQYGMGYNSGLKIIAALAKSLRRARQRQKTKRDKDWMVRSQVLLFAVTNWRTIQENRKKVTWTQLADQYEEATNYEYSVDEETFKKILQRAELTIGNASRRMSKARARTKRNPPRP
jgi:hypothetical protein